MCLGTGPLMWSVKLSHAIADCLEPQSPSLSLVG